MNKREVTFSRLAEITRNSKPTITEMINKFVRMECVYREQCPDDGRILYIRLTDKGKKIAQAERYALRRVIEQMVNSLDEHEMDTPDWDPAESQVIFLSCTLVR